MVKTTGHSNTKYWIFTIGTTINKKSLPSHTEVIDFLESIASEYSFQKEEGTERKKAHYQGWLTLRGPRTSQTRLLEEFTPLVKLKECITLEKCASSSDAIRYTTKEEGRLDGPWIKGAKVNMTLKMNKVELSGWQNIVYNAMIKMKASQDAGTHFATRGVIYVEDIDGGAGKTSFMKYLCAGQRKLKVVKLPLDRVDRLTHALTIVEKMQPDAICIDIPRTLGEDVSLKDLFNTVEELKGGHVVSCMYGNYNQAFYDNPVIVIFGNLSFHMIRDNLSLDRWYCYQLTKEKKKSYSHRKVEFMTGERSLKKYGGIRMDDNRKNLEEIWTNSK